MLAKKKSVTLPEEQISADDSMTLTAEEWSNFQDEIQRQVEGGNKIIDFGKAIRNARYLAMLDRGFNDPGGTGMTFEELERFINEGRIV